MIRAGLVGAGYIAEAHARGYAAHPEARLTAVLSRRPERAQALAQRYGAQAFTQFGALLGVVDVVSICTPTPTHAEMAVAAMRAGKHVLCEKPIARTVEQAENMLRAARESGTKLMIAQVGRYEVDQRKAKEVLDRGDIGPLRMAAQSITGPPPDWSSDHWLMDVSQSGGPALDLAIHSFDFLLWLFSQRATRVYAVGREADYAKATVRFEDGGMGLVEASWAHPRSQGLSVRTELAGPRGTIRWEYDGIASIRLARDDGQENLVLVGEDSFPAQIADFLHCIQHDLPPPVSGEAGLEALRLSLAALDSLRTGRAVTLYG